jgi:hypothetical protein
MLSMKKVIALLLFTILAAVISLLHRQLFVKQCEESTA